ncbi:PKD domain-containing protein [Halapricum salinum]|uniref:PKD domain-containing protein n=1 Tax=Halapricum salinum TaxID=1457250 RepID=A0A4D6HEX6_9EURY|nr:PKD domain-containing protein [Halapricum salinum]QCC51718.1 PKD domain-containing protein [Halapricum salinum]
MTDLRSIRYGQTKDGRIGGTDPNYPDLAQWYYEPVSFYGEKGDKVKLTISSDIFTPIVEIVLPDGSKEPFGTLVNPPFEDPPLERQETEILEQTGTHTLWISHERYTRLGPYQLTLEAIETPNLNARFDYSPLSTSPSSDVTFDASPSDGTIDEFVWEFGDGTEAQGTQVTHHYDTSGEYKVQLHAKSSVDSINIEDIASATVRVEADGNDLVSGFSINNTVPQTNDTVQFDSGLTEDELENEDITLTWEFGDGSTAKGPRVSHTYATSGTYTITLTADGETFTRELTVGTPPVEITGLDRDIGGTLLPQLGIDESVEATVEVPETSDIEQVQFEFAGQQSIATNPPYDASLTIGDVVAPATPLIVQAVTSTGATREIEHEIPIQRLPEWLEFLLKSTDTLGVELTDGEIEITYSPLADLDVGFDIPKDVLSGDDRPDEGGNGTYDFDVGMGGIYDPLVNEAELTAAGTIAAEVMALAFEIKVALTGTVQSTTLALESAQADIDSQLEFDIEPPTVPIPVSIPIPGTNSAIGIVPTVIVSADGTFDFNADFSFDAGTVKPGIELEVSIGIDLELPLLPDGELKGVPSGGIDGEFDVGTDDWNLRATFFLAGKVVLDIPGTEIVLEQDPIWDQPLTGDGASGSSQVTASSLSDPRVRQTSTGGPQPLPEIDSVQTASLSTQSISPRESFRLTDRPYEDIQPALASPTDSKQLVVWSQQDEDKSAKAGNDLVAQWYENGSWSDQFVITDSTYADADPVCAAIETGEILVAWKRFPEDRTTSSDLETLSDVNDTRNKTEIAYSIYDGSSWSNPTLLTSTSITQRRPTVATADGEWYLAWEAFDREVGTSTVRSTVVSPDGSTTSITDQGGAASPDLGSRDDGTVDLAYLVMDNGQVTDITHRVRDGTSTISEQTYSAPEAATVVVANGRVVWATNIDRNPTLVEAADSSTTELSLREDVIEVRELSLSARADQAILSYVSILEGGSTRDLVYRLDRGNGWIFDRSITEDIQDGIRVRYTDLVFTGPASFLSGYSVRDPGTDTVSDVFATTQEFGPAYAIDGSVDSGVAGDQTTLSYELENRGDIDGSEQVTVKILRDGTEIDSITHDPVNSGGTLTRDRDVTIGDGGEFTITVDVPEPSLETEPRDISLVAARAKLRVDEVSAQRPGPNEAVVQIALTNNGGAVADKVPVVLNDAAETVAAPTISQIGAKSTTTIETTLDPQALDNSDTHEVRIDPDGTLPSQAETTPLRQTYLVRPELRVEDVRYREDNDRFVRVLVSNHGPGVGMATVTVRDGTDNELNTTQVSVPPAELDNGQVVSVHRTIDISTPSLVEGQAVAVEIDPEVSNRRQEGLTTVQNVETVLPSEYQGTVGDVVVSATGSSLPVGGQGTVDITAENASQVTLEGLWTDWGVEVDVPSEILEVDIAESGTVTLNWGAAQSSVTPTVTILIPDRYVGGEYLVNIVASNDNGAVEATATLTIE